MPRSHLDTPPEAQHIRELYSFIDSDASWQRQRKLDQKLIDQYFQEQLIQVPNTAEEKRRRRIQPERLDTGEATRIIDLTVSFYPEWPRIGVHNVGTKYREGSAGEEVALAINEAFDQLNPATGDQPWNTGVFWKALIGRSAELIAKGHSYWYDFPMKGEGDSEEDAKERRDDWRRKAPLPVTWLSLPPDATFPASLSTAEDEAICTKSLSWSDIQDMFDEDEMRKAEVEFPKPGSAEWFAPVQLGIYSNRHSIAYMIMARDKTGPGRIGGIGVGGQYDDKIVRNVEHGLGRCAIRIQPGVTTGRKEPPYYWRSVLYPVIGLLEQIDKLAAIAMTSSKFEAFPLLKEHRNLSAIDTEGEGERADIQAFREADILTYDAGDADSGRGREDLNAVFQPQHGDQVRNFLIWALDRASRDTGTPEVLEGQLVANAPAWSHNQASEMARNKLRPLTKAIIAGALDTAESLSVAVHSFGEKVSLARLDQEGKPEGTIVLDPKKLIEFKPVLSGTFDPKTPINWRADLDTMMSLLTQAKALGVPSPMWAMEKLGGIHDFWKHHQDNLEWQAASDPDIVGMQLKQFKERLEVELAEDEGVGLNEFERVAGNLPPQIADAMRARFQNGAAAGARVSPQTAGANRAARPFSTGPTGPQPSERIPPV